MVYVISSLISILMVLTFTSVSAIFIYIDMLYILCTLPIITSLYSSKGLIIFSLAPPSDLFFLANKITSSRAASVCT